MDNVAVSRGISRNHGLSEARFRLALFDRYRPPGFVDGRNRRDRGREDSVSAGGLRILKGSSDWSVERRNET
jgi:hypothetical protein